jgi:DNA polymerase (family 10)
MAKSKKKASPPAHNPHNLTKIDIARILDDVSMMLEITGANPFRVRAFSNAARAMEEQTDDIRKLVESKELLDVQGIGKGIFSDVSNLLESGTFELYDQLRQEVPQGVLDMLRISGMGPKKVKLVYDELGIQSVEALEHAGRSGQLADLPGWGEKTQTNILSGIARMRKYQDRFLYSKAWAEANVMYAAVKDLAGVNRHMIGGSLRRHRETIGDADILVSAAESGSIMDAFTSHEKVATVVAKGSTKSSVILDTGINVDLRVVTDEEYPFAVHYFTGSKNHNTEVRARAKKLGYKLNEYGLFKGKKATPCKDEVELFARLGMDWVPPELRENMGEIEAAAEHRLPKLVEEKDIRGVFHCHTTFSDGKNTLREMVDAARALGHKYFGTGDHSERAIYADGLTREKVKEQRAQVDAINQELSPFVVFHGIESDIFGDGSLDYDEETLASFDYVVASIHGQFNMGEAEMTNRIVKAMSNPFCTMLGHPTGRLLLSREGYQVNLQAIIDAAVEYDVLLEINAHPNRLDLDWRHTRAARDAGAMIVINPDAHWTGDIDYYRYGVGIARKGWLEKKHLLNTKTAVQVKKFLEKRKQKKGI